MSDFLSVRSYEINKPQIASFCVPSMSAELTIILEGELWVEMGPQHQQYRITSDSPALIAHATPHMTTAMTPTKFIVIDVRARLPGPMGISFFPQGRIQQRLTSKLYPLWSQEGRLKLSPMRSSLEHIHEEVKHGQFYPFERSHNTALFIKIKSQLEENSSSGLSLENLANHHQMDRFYFSREFKRNFGVSPNAYLQYLRQEKFLWTLIQSYPTNVLPIALQSGYEDFSTFSRRIKQKCGKSPSTLVQQFNMI